MAGNGLCWVSGPDPQRCFFGTLVLITIICNWACSSTAQTVENSGLCSTTERSTVSYTETYRVSRSQKTYTKCGFLNWGRCTRHRVVYRTETRVAYRDSYNIVFACCNGWLTQPDGSCVEKTTEVTTSQSEPSSALATSKAKKTTPTPAPLGKTTILVSKSSAGPSSTSLPGSSPGEIAEPDGPRSLGKGGESPDDSMSNGEHIGMIGGLVGVAVALVVMVSIMAFFMSRRKRRARDKRHNSHPGVVFELLNASSPARGPLPDIYMEIPDRDANANTAGGTAEDTCPKASSDDYDITFMNTKQPSGLTNTYQDVKEPGSRRDEPKKASNGSPAMKKVDMEVRLQKNGAVYTKTDDSGKGAEVGSPYQNMPGLDAVIKPPEIYDTVGGGPGTPAAYGNMDGCSSKPVIPTDPDDEAYNMIIIGPNGGEQVRYDKLERQPGSFNSGGDQLDTPIPAAPGYSTLGPDTHLGYDKLARNEAHSGDTERKTGTIGPNTYDELGAKGRKTDYDKLARRHSEDHGLDDSGNRSGNLKSLPNGSLARNEYDKIAVGKPADGEIYENLPKKPIQGGLAVKIPSPDFGKPMSAPSAAAETNPVVRPVYDVVPGSQHTTSSPVYDTLPKSPDKAGGATVYDTPPVSPKIAPQASCDDPGVGGPRPVYDTPPVRADTTCPLQFEETSPLYENTPTLRK